MSISLFNKAIRQIGGLLFSILLTLTAVNAHGATLVAPDTALANTEGGTVNPLPIGSSTFHAPRYQQIFDKSLFGTSPISISSFAFRANGAEPTTAQTITLSSLQVIMSTTSKAVDTLSTALLTNLGPDQTVVINNPTSFSQPGTLVKTNSVTYDFDYVFTFTTPFLYDPTKGNLIFDIQSTYGTGDWNRQFDAVFITGDQTSRALTLTSTTPIDSLGLVVQFTYTTPTTTTPEPEMLSMLFVSLMGLGAARLVSSRKK